MAPESTAEAVTLHAVIREIQQLQEEGWRQRAEFEALLRQRDDKFHRFEERFSQQTQLSRTNIREIARHRENNGTIDFGYKLKPDFYSNDLKCNVYINVNFRQLLLCCFWASVAVKC
ncbi:unnamed protein product [Lasius platythorax]|uniref:Uncharacterized protein n=1 Tax=Lasius platythorax TaxID=488582 RepID=A0AAV2NXR4_9HYME